MNTSFLNRDSLLIGTAVIIVLIGTIFYFSNSYLSRVADDRRAFAQQALTAHRTGDTDASIMLSEQLLSKTSDSEEIAYLSMRIAADLFTRNRPGDRDESVRIYKVVAQNQKYSPRIRALAMNELLTLYYTIGDRKFAANVIFNGEPFEKLYDGKSVNLALRKSFEMSDTLYPSAVSSFHIALWYGNGLGAFLNLSDSTKKQYTENLRAWTEKGEALLPVAIAEDTEPNRLAGMYMLNGIAEEYLAIASENNEEEKSSHLDRSEQAYKNALKALAPENEFYTSQTAQFVRFYYANMLVRNFGSARAEDIERILTPVIERHTAYVETTTYFETFVANSMKNPNGSAAAALRRLADIVPAFSPIVARAKQQNSFE